VPRPHPHLAVQEGKPDDLDKMVNILAKLGYDKTPYFKDQVS
jgi:hypothetical protein